MVTLFAVFPFVTLFLLMAVFNRPAYVAAPLTAFLLALGGFFIWGIPQNLLAAAFVKGLGVTLDIMLIIFGAIFFVNVLKQLNFFEPIQSLFSGVSVDKRIQAIMVSWFFVGFIEGIAGFGTPALLAIPILLALGFNPLTSVVLALVGDSIAVVFGAVGVPISIGIAEGVSLQDVGSLVTEVSIGASLLNLLLGVLIPLMISVIVSYECCNSVKRGLEVWKFALVSSVVFMLPSLAAAYWLGPEFPSVIGALTGGVIMIYFLRRGWFQPKSPLLFDQPINTSTHVDLKKLLKVITPYLIVIILLLITRLPQFRIGEFLKSLAWQVESLFNSEVAFAFNWAYSPGIIFIIATLVVVAIFHNKDIDINSALFETVRRVALPFLGLVFVLYIVQILLLSYYNQNGLPSMPLYLAEQMQAVGIAWPFIAPFIGAVGAFIAGSSTVSNLLFSSLQYTTATTIGISAVLVLSLQAVGSALGNMIAIHNILAAEAVAGLKNMEGKILRKTLIPVLIYGSILGVIGLLVSLII